MHELRLAFRSLRNRPLFAAVAIITLALGIGATTTLFTIVNAVLLRPLPYPEASQIVSISGTQDGKDQQVIKVPDYFAFRSASAFSSLAMYGGETRVVRAGSSPTRVNGESVSASFFSVFGVQPALGRTIRPDEDVPGGPSVVVLSHELWQRFGSDASIVGKTVALDDKPVTVVGVMPEGFAAPRAATFWVPMQMDSVPDPKFMFYMQVVGRLKPGGQLAQARSQLAPIIARSEAQLPKGMQQQGPVTPVVMTLHERMFGSTRPALMMLLGAVGFLLLIACANVANLLLARGAARQREFAVRVALGASRWRLARQLMWESLVVSGIGGGLGLLIPLWTVGFFVRLSPASVARVDNIGVDGRVLAFTAVISVVTGLVFGLIPAFAATRPDSFQSLKEGGARTTGTATQRRIRRGLVVVELSTALMLLTGASLLTRSFSKALAVDMGFNPAQTISITASLTQSAYQGDTVARQVFFDRLVTQLRALPGVKVVGYSNAPALGGYRMSTQLLIPGTNKQSPPIAVMRTSADFMTAFGSKLVAGRFLNAGDRAGAPPVVVLSENAARALFPGGTALGQTMPTGARGKQAATVVGIVKDLQEPGSDTPMLPQIYQPIEQEQDTPYQFVLRYTGDATPILAAIRRITSGFDPMQTEVTVGLMQERVDKIVAPRRFESVVINVFAALALILAAVGLYGVMAYQVTQRTQELGIRMALGADRSRVLRFVLRDGMGLALLGTALGVALSLALSRFMAGMLFGVSARDPFTFVAVPAVLILVALAACYLPARRATKVDPMVALRYE